MPSAVELRAGDLVLRPWTEADAAAVELTPASPEIGRYFGVLCTHPGNERSQRVAERAGFRPDGELPEYARFHDGTTRALRFVHP